MKISPQERLRLKRLVKELKTYRAPHTEFVSVYIPQGYELSKIMQHLAQEQGTATNIKSAGTRKNVQSALEKMMQHLRNYKRTPKNGLMIFTGNIAAGEGKIDMKVWCIEPPVPLKTRIYRCDKIFMTEILEDMLMDHSAYGLVVLDKRDATIALLKGKTIVPLQTTHSEVPGKFKAGGQCLLPNTLITINKESKMKLSTLNINDEILSFDFNENKLIKDIILDKWKTTKNELYTIKTNNLEIKSSKDHLFFVKKNEEIKEIPAQDLKIKDILFTTNNKEKKETPIISINKEKGKFDMIDISVGNQNFIANGLIVHNSAQRFARQREGAKKAHFKKIADHMKEQFLSLGHNLKGIIIGGPGVTVGDFLNKDYVTGDLKRKIIGTKDLSYTGDFGLQELLDKCQDLLSDEEVSQEKKIMTRFFKEFRDNAKKVTYGEKETLKALKMNAVDTLLISETMEEDKIFQYEEMAQEGGSTFKLISVETREGVQLRDLGKIAAILRFEIEQE
jgi:peptide subunit release factor 1 (eRF1)